MQHASLTDLNSALVEVLIRSTINVHYNFELLQCQPKYEILQEGVLYLVQVAVHSKIFGFSMRLPGLSKIKSINKRNLAG